jgi:pimeloyl-ACP methyl ester carboxylesterase
MLSKIEVGEGPAVLLLHGWTGFKEAWGDLPESLAAAGMRAVAVDLPGWGQSPAPARFRHRPSDYAAALAPLVERLAPVAVVGHSMGAQSAVLLARDHPRAVSRLVTIAPAAIPLSRRPFPRSLADTVVLPVMGPPTAGVVMAGLKRNRRAWLSAYAEAVAYPMRHAADPRWQALADLAWRRFRTVPSAVLARSLRATALCDLRSPAAEVRQPALVVVGDRDRTTGRDAPLLARALPAGRLVQVPDTGHLPHLERPDVALPWMVEFLRPVGSGGAR